LSHLEGKKFEKINESAVMGGAKINVLLVEEGSSIITLRVIRCLGITGQYTIHVLSFSGKLIPSFRYSRYVSSYAAYDPQNDEQALDLILRTLHSTGAGIMLPLMEKQTKIIAANIGEFKGICLLPPLPDAGTLEIVINKYLLSKWLFEKGFDENKPVSIQKLINRGSEPDSLHFPLLMKPYWGSSGEGIVRIDQRSQLDAIIDSVENTGQQYLIQPFYPGKDIDLSALVENGRILVYTIQRSAYDKKILKYSKRIEFITDPSLLELCGRIFEELNYSGIVHLDFRYDPDHGKYHLVDFNARYWSTLSGSLKAGVNFPLLACMSAENSAISLQQYRHMGFLSSENPFYILGNSFKYIGKSFQFLANNELYYGLGDPLPMVFNFINLVKTKISWHFGRKQTKIPA
jgi:predicted ATP-grasp superfamily ATP-dependent carboligase